MDICMFGLPKSGKTSIIKVIFQKMSPQQTMMLDSTQRMEIVDANLSPLIQFKILDFSGSFDFKDVNPPEASYLENCKALIYVLDIFNEPYQEALNYLYATIKYMQNINRDILIHVFIHKIDSEQYLQEEKRLDIKNYIKEMVDEEKQSSKEIKDVNIEYHFTTLYEQSLFESFSKVTQKVISQVPQLTSLLDSLTTNCKMEKVFLFEMVSKLYMATDSAPVDQQNFALCSEMIDVFIDVSYIYGQQKNPNLQYDINSQSVIKLSDKKLLLLKEVEKFMALICIIKEQNYDRPYLVDYNIDIFKQGLMQIFKSGGLKKQQ